MKYLFIVFIGLGLFSCNSDREIKGTPKLAQVVSMDIFNSPGYDLMKQKCFICHFEKPDPARKNEMIAPPMLRVQEHYKPIYPDKAEFIAAIVKWVNNPLEENTLMPGAVRKFYLMAKLPYAAADLQLIAAALYDADLGNMPQMNMHKGQVLALNNGDKWQLNPDHIIQIESVITQLDDFTSDDISAYNDLGKDIFDKAKILLLERSYSKALFEELHTFFNGIEENIHLLIGAQSIGKAKEQQHLLKDKFDDFSNFFE